MLESGSENTPGTKAHRESSTADLHCGKCGHNLFGYEFKGFVAATVVQEEREQAHALRHEFVHPPHHSCGRANTPTSLESPPVASKTSFGFRQDLGDFLVGSGHDKNSFGTRCGSTSDYAQSTRNVCGAHRVCGRSR